jgi:hypothetical protein
MKTLMGVLAALVVAVLVAGVVAPLPSTSYAPAPVKVSSDTRVMHDTFCNAPYESRRVMWMAIAPESWKGLYRTSDPSGRRMMWTSLGARVGCTF